MTTTTTDLQQQLRAERSAVETLYRAFSEQDPDLVDTILAPDWDDIPLAPEVSFRLHEFHTLANGMIIATWHMEDWFGLFLQLGQFPPPA